MFIKKLFSLIVFALFTFSSIAGQTPKISQAELVSLLAQPQNTSYVVLDVRTPEEFNNGHIKGAINISHNTIKENLRTLDNYKDKIMVVHCRSGRRAISAENILRENGFNDVRHLEGDMLGWVAAKRPLVK